MPNTLDRVVALVSRQAGVRADSLTAASAIDQDIGIGGDDVDERVAVLAAEFGDQVKRWPWQRYASLSEPHLFIGLHLLWRLLTWPIRRRLFDPSPYERLELGHIANVVDAGHWLER